MRSGRTRHPQVKLTVQVAPELITPLEMNDVIKVRFLGVKPYISPLFPWGLRRSIIVVIASPAVPPVEIFEVFVLEFCQRELFLDVFVHAADT
jgi:hypothetical protein